VPTLSWRTYRESWLKKGNLYSATPHEAAEIRHSEALLRDFRKAFHRCNQEGIAGVPANAMTALARSYPSLLCWCNLPLRPFEPPLELLLEDEDDTPLLSEPPPVLPA